MKIFLAGSMSFAKEILETARLLKELGHEVLYAPDTEDCVTNPGLNEDEEHCFNIDIMRACMDLQEQCEAIFVLNHDKNGEKGYIGAHTLIELGLAYYLKQKIFLLHSLPSKEEIRHAVEVMHMKPVILDGDIERIKEYL
jgi:hypothetical protein